MRLALILALCLLSWPAQAGGGFDHSHSRWTDWLERYATPEGVRYEAALEARNMPDAYLKDLAAVDRKEFEQFTASQKKAYWINLYNAATARLILKHYPLQSIKDIGSLFTSPWKKDIGDFLGQSRTLDEIEHEILRKRYPDFRIHAALNCASKSCPILRSKAYVAERLDTQLNAAMKEWIGDPLRNRVDVDDRTIHVSKVFKWYREDFSKESEGIPGIFERYHEGNPKIDFSSYDVKFLDYDWSLNSAP